MTKLGFGIIGTGAISDIHAKAISEIENAELIGVYDASFERTLKFAEKQNCMAFESLDAMLKDDKVNIINICTPSGLHAEHSIRAAKAKKNIVIEKPMAITAQQIEQIICACEENNVFTTVVSQLRFTEAIVKTKKAIEDGSLGKILLADIKMKYYRTEEYYNSSWRGTWNLDGGGALMNQGIHGIDLMQYLMGGIKSVYCSHSTLLHKIEVEDEASLLVEYNNGAKGVIQSTTCVYPGYPRTIEITGTKGTVIIKEDTIEKWDLKDSEEVLIPITSKVNSYSSPLDIPYKYHKKQFEDLLNCIFQNKKPLLDIYEGKKSVEIILAAYKSNKENKRIYLL